MKTIIAAITAAFVATPALAGNPNCASREQAIEILTIRYGEERIAAGVDANGLLLEWWGNADTGSWTITATVADTSCILSQGDGYSRVVLPPNV